MADKFTPGPWRINGILQNSGAITIGAVDQRIVIADVHNAASFGDFISAAMKGRRDFGAPDTATTQMANADLIAAAPDQHEALKRLLFDLEELMRCSAGVVGLHLNDDVAAWEELTEGGQFEKWLAPAISAAKAALSKATGVQS